MLKLLSFQYQYIAEGNMHLLKDERLVRWPLMFTSCPVTNTSLSCINRCTLSLLEIKYMWGEFGKVSKFLTLFNGLLSIYILQFVLSFLSCCRMFSKSARSRLNVCCWAAFVRVDSSSSSISRHREAPAGKAWTSWINPPPQQTSAMSTCEPPGGVIVWDLQKKNKKKHHEKKLNFLKSRKKEQKSKKC